MAWGATKKSAGRIEGDGAKVYVVSQLLALDRTKC